MYDYHIHSNISADSEETMDNICRAALSAGLKEICFTEHIDVDFPLGMEFIADFEAYGREYAKVKDAYPGLTVKKGLEVGLMPHVIEKTNACIGGRAFDFIIASQHIVNGEDLYSEEFFRGRTEKQACGMYFTELFQCLKMYDNYCVIGHLGVPSRFSPSKKPIRYQDYADLLDAILRHLVQNGKGLEINTKGRADTGEDLPSMSILKRYREVGGEIVTTGSDSHRADRVGEGALRVLAYLKEMGFKYICTFDQMRPVFNKIK
jgi:histidinol-phosphatase (PHP family)